MANKRKNLSDQLIGVETPKRVINTIDYENLIKHQKQVIKLLHQQITQLRQYLFYVADYDQNEPLSLSRTGNPQEGNQSISAHSQKKTRRRKIEIDKSNRGLKGLIQEVMNAVDAKIPEQIMTKLNEMKDKANKKIQPLFIERIKQKQVPVTIEVVKQVEKEVIVQKIVEVPIFRQKIIEKYITPNSFDTLQYDRNKNKKKGDKKETKKLNLTSQMHKEKDNSESTDISNIKNDSYLRWGKWGKKKKKNVQKN